MANETSVVAKGKTNFSIPRIKNTACKDSLQSTNINNRDIQDLIRDIGKNCLDVNFMKNIQVIDVSLVHNPELLAKYVKKRAEMKDAGRNSQSLIDQFGFLLTHNSDKYRIARCGLRTASCNSSRLGNSLCGISLNRFFDVEVNRARLDSGSSVEIFVFKFLTGRCKSFNLGNIYKKCPDIEPTPNYDSHIANVNPIVSDSHYIQMAKSSIYLYEYTEDCVPAIYPRHCLPFATIKIRKVDQPKDPAKRVNIPRETSSITAAPQTNDKTVASADNSGLKSPQICTSGESAAPETVATKYMPPVRTENSKNKLPVRESHSSLAAATSNARPCQTTTIATISPVKSDPACRMPAEENVKISVLISCGQKANCTQKERPEAESAQESPQKSNVKNDSGLKPAEANHFQHVSVADSRQNGDIALKNVDPRLGRFVNPCEAGQQSTETTAGNNIGNKIDPRFLRPIISHGKSNVAASNKCSGPISQSSSSVHRSGYSHLRSALKNGEKPIKKKVTYSEYKERRLQSKKLAIPTNDNTDTLEVQTLDLKSSEKSSDESVQPVVCDVKSAQLSEQARELLPTTSENLAGKVLLSIENMQEVKDVLVHISAEDNCHDMKETSLADENPRAMNQPQVDKVPKTMTFAKDPQIGDNCSALLTGNQPHLFVKNSCKTQLLLPHAHDGDKASFEPLINVDRTSSGCSSIAATEEVAEKIPTTVENVSVNPSKTNNLLPSDAHASAQSSSQNALLAQYCPYTKSDHQMGSILTEEHKIISTQLSPNHIASSGNEHCEVIRTKMKSCAKYHSTIDNHTKRSKNICKSDAPRVKHMRDQYSRNHECSFLLFHTTQRTDKSEEKPLPESIPMRELGISCYLLALGDMKYQPTMVLVDFQQVNPKRDCDQCTAALESTSRQTGNTEITFVNEDKKVASDLSLQSMSTRADFKEDETPNSPCSQISTSKETIQTLVVKNCKAEHSALVQENTVHVLNQENTGLLAAPHFSESPQDSQTVQNQVQQLKLSVPENCTTVDGDTDPVGKFYVQSQLEEAGIDINDEDLIREYLLEKTYKHNKETDGMIVKNNSDSLIVKKWKAWKNTIAEQKKNKEVFPTIGSLLALRDLKVADSKDVNCENKGPFRNISVGERTTLAARMQEKCSHTLSHANENQSCDANTVNLQSERCIDDLSVGESTAPAAQDTSEMRENDSTMAFHKRKEAIPSNLDIKIELSDECQEKASLRAPVIKEENLGAFAIISKDSADCERSSVANIVKPTIQKKVYDGKPMSSAEPNGSRPNLSERAEISKMLAVRISELSKQRLFANLQAESGKVSQNVTDNSSAKIQEREQAECEESNNKGSMVKRFLHKVQENMEKKAHFEDELTAFHKEIDSIDTEHRPNSLDVGRTEAFKNTMQPSHMTDTDESEETTAAHTCNKALVSESTTILQHSNQPQMTDFENLQGPSSESYNKGGPLSEIYNKGKSLICQPVINDQKKCSTSASKNNLTKITAEAVPPRSLLDLSFPTSADNQSVSQSRMSVQGPRVAPSSHLVPNGQGVANSNVNSNIYSQQSNGNLEYSSGQTYNGMFQPNYVTEHYYTQDHAMPGHHFVTGNPHMLQNQAEFSRHPWHNGQHSQHFKPPPPWMTWKETGAPISMDGHWQTQHKQSFGDYDYRQLPPGDSMVMPSDPVFLGYPSQSDVMFHNNSSAIPHPVPVEQCMMPSPCSNNGYANPVTMTGIQNNFMQSYPNQSSFWSSNGSAETGTISGLDFATSTSTSTGIPGLDTQSQNLVQNQNDGEERSQSPGPAASQEGHESTNFDPASIFPVVPGSSHEEMCRNFLKSIRNTSDKELDKADTVHIGMIGEAYSDDEEMDISDTDKKNVSNKDSQSKQSIKNINSSVGTEETVTLRKETNDTNCSSKVQDHIEDQESHMNELRNIMFKHLSNAIQKAASAPKVDKAKKNPLHILKLLREALSKRESETSKHQLVNSEKKEQSEIDKSIIGRPIQSISSSYVESDKNSPNHDTSADTEVKSISFFEQNSKTKPAPEVASNCMSDLSLKRTDNDFLKGACEKVWESYSPEHGTSTVCLSNHETEDGSSKSTSTADKLHSRLPDNLTISSIQCARDFHRLKLPKSISPAGIMECESKALEITNKNDDYIPEKFRKRRRISPQFRRQKCPESSESEIEIRKTYTYDNKPSHCLRLRLSDSSPDEPRSQSPVEKNIPSKIQKSDSTERLTSSAANERKIIETFDTTRKSDQTNFISNNLSEGLESNSMSLPDHPRGELLNETELSSDIQNKQFQETYDQTGSKAAIYDKDDYIKIQSHTISASLSSQSIVPDMRSLSTTSIKVNSEGKVYLSDVPLDVLSYARAKILNEICQLNENTTVCHPESQLVISTEASLVGNDDEGNGENRSVAPENDDLEDGELIESSEEETFVKRNERSTTLNKNVLCNSLENESKSLNDAAIKAEQRSAQIKSETVDNCIGFSNLKRSVMINDTSQSGHHLRTSDSADVICISSESDSDTPHHHQKQSSTKRFPQDLPDGTLSHVSCAISSGMHKIDKPVTSHIRTVQIEKPLERVSEVETLTNNYTSDKTSEASGCEGAQAAKIRVRIRDSDHKRPFIAQLANCMLHPLPAQNISETENSGNPEQSRTCSVASDKLTIKIFNKQVLELEKENGTSANDGTPIRKVIMKNCESNVLSRDGNLSDKTSFGMDNSEINEELSATLKAVTSDKSIKISSVVAASDICGSDTDKKNAHPLEKISVITVLNQSSFTATTQDPQSLEATNKMQFRNCPRAIRESAKEYSQTNKKHARRGGLRKNKQGRKRLPHHSPTKKRHIDTDSNGKANPDSGSSKRGRFSPLKLGKRLGYLYSRSREGSSSSCSIRSRSSSFSRAKRSASRSSYYSRDGRSSSITSNESYHYRRRRSRSTSSDCRNKRWLSRRSSSERQRGNDISRRRKSRSTSRSSDTSPYRSDHRYSEFPCRTPHRNDRSSGSHRCQSPQNLYRDHQPSTSDFDKLKICNVENPNDRKNSNSLVSESSKDSQMMESIILKNSQANKNSSSSSSVFTVKSKDVQISDCQRGGMSSIAASRATYSNQPYPMVSEERVERPERYAYQNYESSNDYRPLCRFQHRASYPSMGQDGPEDVTVKQYIISQLGISFAHEVEFALPYSLNIVLNNPRYSEHENRRKAFETILQCLKHLSIPTTGIMKITFEPVINDFGNPPFEIHLQNFPDDQILLEVNVIKESMTILERQQRQRAYKLRRGSQLQCKPLKMPTEAELKEAADFNLGTFAGDPLPPELTVPVNHCFNFHVPMEYMLKGDALSVKESLDLGVSTILELYKCAHHGREHFRVPELVLFEEEKSEWYAMGDCFLVLSRPIPKKVFTRLLALKQSIEEQMQDSDQTSEDRYTARVQLISERASVLKAHVGNITRKRANKMKTTYDLLQECRRYLRSVIGLEGLRNMPVFNTYLGAMRWHYDTLDSEIRNPTVPEYNDLLDQYHS